MIRPGRRALSSLPLVLAGPIVRRVEARGATVWIALKEACSVTLEVWDTDEPSGVPAQLVGTVDATQIGAHLYVAVVTALPKTSLDALFPGERYFYQLTFGAKKLADKDVLAVGTADITPITYGTKLPSFTMPAATLEDLRIFHGSCRKPHGGANDTMIVLDDMLANAPQATRLRSPSEYARPQQLILTGDQIYADDVAGPLLATIVELADCLFETTNESDRERLYVASKGPPASQLLPNLRHKYLGTTFGAEDDELDCHLLRFAELACMYLLVWNDCVWPGADGSATVIASGVPTPDEVPAIFDPGSKSTQIANEEAYSAHDERLEDFFRAIAATRRVFANIATYMILDDHEITDDALADYTWCLRCLGSSAKATAREQIGRRVLRNALLAYTVFQAWGNDPEQFTSAGLPAHLRAWASRAPAKQLGSVDDEILTKLVGVPTNELMQRVGKARGRYELRRDGNALDFAYAIEWACHRMIVLDTRTRRIYERPGNVRVDDKTKMTLVDATSIAKQLQPASSLSLLTLVVSPMIVIEDPTFDLTRLAGSLLARYKVDADTWSRDSVAFSTLLEHTWNARPAIVLAGDVHYGGAAMLSRIEEPASTRGVPFVISSPLSNAFSGLKRLGLEALGGSQVGSAFETAREKVATTTFETWHSKWRIFYDNIGELTFVEDDDGWTCVHTWFGFERQTIVAFRSIEMPLAGTT